MDLDQNDLKKEDDGAQNLFDQETNEDEDFETPSVFKKTKVLMIKSKINENSKIITGNFSFSSDVE